MEMLPRGYHWATSSDFSHADDGGTWSERELRLRCAGQESTRITCGYCGARKRAAKDSLVAWFHAHACGIEHIHERAA